jgi:transposase
MESKLTVGLDAHPDSFTAALVTGVSVRASRVEKVSGPIDLPRMEQWFDTHVPRHAVVALESSSNSFTIYERLSGRGYTVLVLDSVQVGRICQNSQITDRVSAVRIAKVYLSGLSESVWVPDPKTRMHREVFAAYRRAVTDCTRSTNRIKMLLNEHTIRLKKGQKLTDKVVRSHVFGIREWSDTQRLILEELFADYDRARTKRKRLEKQISREIVRDPDMLQLVRIFGLRKINVYGLFAMIGDIHRFKNPKHLTGYFGLKPNFKESGKSSWRGGITRAGRRDIRSLLVEAGHVVLRYRSRSNPLHAWGWKLQFRKGTKRAVVAVARKITVAVWYLMMGKPFTTKENSVTLYRKLQELAKDIGIAELRSQGYVSYEAFIKDRIELMRDFACGHT